MEFCIQDPSYSDSKYLHEALLSAFDIGIEGGGAYAFASCSGIELLLHDESFRKFIETGTFFLIVGMDDITNKKALESLKALRDRYGNHLTTKVYIHNKRGSIFHPKYSWIKTADGGLLIIGSGNLTEQGLRSNREAYSIIKCDQAAFRNVMEVWTRWLRHSQPFLFDVDDERALQLAELNSQKTVAVAEAKRSVQRATGHAARPDFSDVFNNQPQNIHRRPFSLAGAQANNQGAAATGEGAATTPVVPVTIDDESYDESYWMMNSSSEVLIAEIPKSGDRWKQANFDKGTFENYFGATCGENGEYRILLKNVDSNGKLGKTEVRPSVSVSSQNYRFELEAAAGLDYPNDGKRPICVFARIAERDFLYELIMPSNNNYDDVLAALNDRERPGTKMRRIVFSCEDVINKAPQLGILKRMEY